MAAASGARGSLGVLAVTLHDTAHTLIAPMRVFVRHLMRDETEFAGEFKKVRPRISEDIPLTLFVALALKIREEESRPMAQHSAYSFKAFADHIIGKVRENRLRQNIIDSRFTKLDKLQFSRLINDQRWVLFCSPSAVTRPRAAPMQAGDISMPQ